MKILVTGGAGYIGSVLVGQLLKAGHRVICLDALWFGDSGTKPFLKNPNYTLIAADIRDPGAVAGAIREADAVIHLAGVVGEPAVGKNLELATEVNLGGLANVLENLGARPIIHASSCSVYGWQRGEVTEESAPNPQGPYAKLKLLEEEAVANRAKRWTILRLSTAFGRSPRMRFDLMLQEFVRELALRGELVVYSPEAIRPLLHVMDIARAFLLALESPRTMGEVINVGDDSMNFRKIDIAERARRLVGGKVVIRDGGEDPRDYAVSFGKIRELLGFRARVNLEEGIKEIAEGLRGGLWPDPYAPGYHNHAISPE